MRVQYGRLPEGEGKLTPKMLEYCEEYVLTGSSKMAYLKAYNTSNMKSGTISSKGSTMLTWKNIGDRISEIREKLYERNRATIDELIRDLSKMVRFDPGDMYDDNGALLPIKQMSKEVRQMIISFDLEELYFGKGKDKENYGCLKKVRLIPKLDAIEKLMKFLGAYQVDNIQKAPIIQYENVSKQYPNGHMKIVKKSG